MSSSPWPFPDRIRLPWKISAALMRLPSVYISTRLLRWTQKVQVKNGQRLVKAVMERPKGTALLTVCNHLSYLDDPALYHILPLRSLFFERKVKWTPSAQEICFTTKASSYFFSHCHAVPVTRGEGVYQHGVDFLISKLNEGHWIHIYPEGKMNDTGRDLRLKWGVGRAISEAKKLPIIIPMWLVDSRVVVALYAALLSNAHFCRLYYRDIVELYPIGLDNILPIYPPLKPTFFQKFTVYIGDPINLSSVVEYQKLVSPSAVVRRKQITDIIQEKMRELKVKAEELHSSWNCTSRIAYRRL